MTLQIKSKSKHHHLIEKLMAKVPKKYSLLKDKMHIVIIINLVLVKRRLITSILIAYVDSISHLGVIIQLLVTMQTRVRNK